MNADIAVAYHKVIAIDKLVVQCLNCLLVALPELIYVTVAITHPYAHIALKLVEYQGFYMFTALEQVDFPLRIYYHCITVKIREDHNSGIRFKILLYCIQVQEFLHHIIFRVLPF